jgi:5-amino-6-(5-phosphoribosylamino)uracil reductase
MAWADGCLIGAQTLRQHGSTCLIHDHDLLASRRDGGRPCQPIAIAVSRSGCFPASLPFFLQPLERWLLLAGAVEPVSMPPEPCGFHRCLEWVSWPQVLASLLDLGIERLVVLGGAALAAGLLHEGLVDELQLTLVPHLLGGSHLWIPAVPAGDGGVDDRDWRLMEQRPLGDGEILLRYVVVRGSPHGVA